MKCKVMAELLGTVLLSALFVANVTAAEAPAEIVFEHGYTEDIESGSIKAYSSEGNLLWSQETGSYSVTQLPRVAEIGRNEELYYYCEDGAIIALDIYTGEMLWANPEFTGSPTSCVFDDDGILYICGYFGPDIYAVTPKGETVIDTDMLTSNYFWPYKLEWADHTQQVLTIYFEGGVDEFEGGGMEYVDVWSLMEDYFGEDWYYDGDEIDEESNEIVYTRTYHEPVYMDEGVSPITLYVVNCNQSITLRRSPSSLSEEICQIPLGASVSYQYYGANGFYYIDYCGYSGIDVRWKKAWRTALFSLYFWLFSGLRNWNIRDKLKGNIEHRYRFIFL